MDTQIDLHANEPRSRTRRLIYTTMSPAHSHAKPQKNGFGTLSQNSKSVSLYSITQTIPQYPLREYPSILLRKMP